MALPLTLFAVVLLVFHLVLLLRWDKVRRPAFFLLGCAGLAVMFLGNFFLVGDNLRVMIVTELFYCLGLLAALAGAVGATFPGDLPAITVAQPRKDNRPQPPVSVEKL